MAVTFVIGRAGSGKTARCFSRTAGAMRADPLGPPILWIVPKQATFMAERGLTCASGLGAFCRTRVLSFDQLAEEVFAECGGSAVPQVTPLGRQMILGHLLRRLQPKLDYFKSVARQPGLAAELDSTFSELERCGKGTTELAELVAELEVTNPADVDGGSLVAKLRDLRLLYESYHAFLGQDRLDPHRRMQQVLDLLAHCPFARGSTAYVDGFTDFTENERRVLGVLGKACATLEITLTIDPDSAVVRNPHTLPDDASLFRKGEEAYRKLWFTFEQEAVTTQKLLLPDSHRFRSDAIRHLERTCFSDLASQPPAEAAALPAVELLTAPDRATEVEAVARRIRTLAQEGARYRDVAVLVRTLDDYHGTLDATFREHGIPYFVDRRRSASHHPLLQFVRAVFRVARFDWPHDDVVALLKTGLACLSPEEADEVEDYVLLHRVRGWRWESAEPWSYRRDLTRGGGDDAEEGDTPPAETQAQRVDRLRRRVAEHLAPLLRLSRQAHPSPLRQFVRELSELFERCGVRSTLAGWMDAAADADDLEQRAEHEQVWNELTALLAQMADLLGDEPVTAAEFAEVLESGLERFDLALTPPTVDQVLVGQVDRTRTPPGLRVAVVMGLNAGEFPRAAHDPTVLSDTERRELRRRKLDLDGDGRRDLLDERFLGYFAFTRPGDRLVLTRPLTSDGERLAEPSPFWLRVRELFPGLDATHVSAPGTGRLRDAWTPRQLVVALMNDVRTIPADPDEQATFASCYQWLSTSGASDAATAKARAQAWPALSYTNDAALSSGAAAELFPVPLAASAGQLETFAACPFRHFLRYGLGLSEREAQGVTALDLSRVYHHILERLLATAIRDGVDLSDPDATVPQESIRAYARQIGQSLRGELMLSSARNAYLLARVEKTLTEVIAAHREMMRRGQFRPAQSGVKFDDGPEGARALPPLKITTPAGAELALRGRIDRVDVLPEGGDAAVFDYRLGSRDLSLHQVYHGLSLQLLTSLLALSDAGEATGKAMKPAAAFYLQVTRGIGEVAHPSEALDPADPRFLLRVKPRGVFDGTYLPTLDKDLNTGKSDVVQVQVKKEGGFGNRRSSDVADPGEFRGLLAHVRRKLGALADAVLAGEISVAPYRLNTETPCPNCGYRSVCRFDPAINRYRNLQPMTKEQVLKTVAEGEGAAGGA